MADTGPASITSRATREAFVLGAQVLLIKIKVSMMEFQRLVKGFLTKPQCGAPAHRKAPLPLEVDQGGLPIGQEECSHRYHQLLLTHSGYFVRLSVPVPQMRPVPAPAL